MSRDIRRKDFGERHNIERFRIHITIPVGAAHLSILAVFKILFIVHEVNPGERVVSMECRFWYQCSDTIALLRIREQDQPIGTGERVSSAVPAFDKGVEGIWL